MSLVKAENWWEEKRDFKKTVKEEYLDIDETLIELEKNSNIIRLELNTIELPLFSKDTKRVKNQIKVYHFKTDKSSYLEVEAPASHSIPGEFEERVFITLTKIMKNNNYSKKFLVSANEILENMGLSNSFYYKRIKDSLTLLSKTNYTFMNSLYSNIESGIIDKKVISSIMNITIISKKDKRAEEIEFFEDGRIKEIYEISFSDYFYDNIIRKGYLAFDSEKLLSIENSIARSIYTITEKWRGYNLKFRKEAFFIARRIPLRWDKTQIKRTIDTLEKALIELKSQNLIKDYKIIKESKWELAEIEITYDEVHNKTKRETFYTDKNEFTDMEMLVHSTEEKIKTISDEIENGNIAELLKIFPERIIEMKTFEPFIKNAVEKYGFEYVKYTSEYTLLNNPKNLKGYLSKALSENYADEYIAQKKVKEKKKIKKTEEIKPIEEAQIVETFKYSWEDYLSLDPALQGEIEEAAYEEFLIQSESSDNKIVRGIFDKSKKSIVLKVMGSYNFEKPTEIVDPVVEPKEKPKTPKEQKKVETKSIVENSNEIIGVYQSIPEFMVVVSKLAKEKNIDFDLVNIVPVFKLFCEYEDINIKIVYSEDTKQGTIIIK